MERLCGRGDGAQYSALKQIDRGNVGQLESAWFYPAPGAGAFNPIVIDGVLYAMGPQRSIVALEAATGKRSGRIRWRARRRIEGSITGKAGIGPTGG